MVKGMKKFKVIFVLMALISTSNVLSDPNKWPLQAKGEVRYMKFIKVYDASLFSPSKVNANNVLNADVSKCLKLDYAVDLTVDKFRLVTDKILKQQHNPAYLSKIKQPLERLQKSYKPVKKGDYYRLCYNGKSKKLSMALNKQQLVEIQSEELAKAYLGIWLSKNKPISYPLFNQFFNPRLAANVKP